MKILPSCLLELGVIVIGNWYTVALLLKLIFSFSHLSMIISDLRLPVISLLLNLAHYFNNPYPPFTPNSKGVLELSIGGFPQDCFPDRTRKARTLSGALIPSLGYQSLMLEEERS